MLLYVYPSTREMEFPMVKDNFPLVIPLINRITVGRTD